MADDSDYGTRVDDDYQEYLEWSKTFEPGKDNQADTFMFIMFWWVPILPVLFFADLI